MKSMCLQATGKYTPKFTPQHNNYGRMWSGVGSDPPFHDKTSTKDSRPQAKLTLRNANRSLKKKARQIEKRNIRREAEET